MTLRTRLGLLLTLTLVLGLVLFGALAYILFVRQQSDQLESLLLRDLERVQALMRDPAAGASLVDETAGDFSLQLVDRRGNIAVPYDAQEALPLHEAPQLVSWSGEMLLVASLPWIVVEGTPSGTIRLALNVTEALKMRAGLLRSLLLSGLFITLAALIIGLWVLRRALRPLARLAAEARDIEPARPRLAHYHGPEDEVAALAQALNAALDGIRARQEAERASLAEIAHELAAPLTLVAGHLASLAIERPPDPRLAAAHDAAQELLYTSQDLLTLARGELERPLDMEIFDLGTVLSRMAGEYPGVKLELPDDGCCEIAGNPLRLSQLVRNLVRNAVQAAGSPERVCLRLVEAPGQLRLEVRDQGAGILAEELPHVFERFYSRRGGVGVGLSVARGIAVQHGGDISVASRPGEGTCFTVSLPSLEAQLS